MERLIYFSGVMHKFCVVVIKLKHVRSCPSFSITYTCLYGVKKIRYFVRLELTSVIVSHQQMNGV